MNESEDRTWFVTPEMLTDRIVLEEYLAEQWAPIARRGGGPDALADLVAMKKAPFDALARPGDEWWTWISGTEPLMQMGGLALVRAGKIIWARQDWIS